MGCGGSKGTSTTDIKTSPKATATKEKPKSQVAPTKQQKEPEKVSANTGNGDVKKTADAATDNNCLDLYLALPSAPCRALMMTCAATGIKYNLKEIDLMKGEHMKPEFSQINPMHTVPTMNDKGFILYESRPMMVYLMSTYAPDNSLYPSDLQKKALVDRWLNYDIGTFYKAIGSVAYPQLFGKGAPDESAIKALHDVFDFVNSHLCDKEYLLGDTMTIADFSMIAGMGLIHLLDFDCSKWTHISAWCNRVKALPYFDECNRGLCAWKENMKNMQKSTDKKNDETGEGTPVPPPVDAKPVPATDGKAPEKSDGLTVYYNRLSPPSRATLMTLKATGIECNLKEIDLMKGEHKEPWYLAINPCHAVPAVVDGDFVLWESRAVLVYLMSKHTAESSLYPSDLQERALVDRWLHYDIGTFMNKTAPFAAPVVFGSAEPDNEKDVDVQKCLDFVNSQLENKPYICGDNLTIADFSLHCSMSMLFIMGYDWSKWENISAWWNRIKELPYYDDCNHGMYAFKETYEAKKQ